MSWRLQHQFRCHCHGCGCPEQIAVTLSNAETIEDQDGFKNYYAVFNNETGADRSELTLLDSREGLTSFVTWACGINSDNANDDLAVLAFKDPLRGAPKAFKDYKGYSPIIVLAIRQPQGGNPADAADYMKELLSNSTEVEASIARGLIEDIAVPEASDDKDDEASGDEDDEASGDEDDEASGDGEDQDKEVSD
ncbi:hypothetical protein KJ359_011226 [Pestalotiopsis sp. 9143b]|nr:hypothetical protein KJ359_011226 [Pestalotiopsis sp. 9143b]